MPNHSVQNAIKQRVIELKEKYPNWSSRKVANLVGLHHKTVNRILKQAKFVQEIVDFEELSQAPEGVQIMDETANSEPEGDWIEGKGYVYNGQSDSYVTVLKCRPRPLVMTGQKFRAMKKAYSDWDGNKDTINEICRRFAVPRDQFIELKAIHGWTHEAEPFTREEMLSRDVEDLADDAFQQRRQAVWETFEKKKWHQTKVDAQKWNSLEQNFILPLKDHITTLVPVHEFPHLILKSSRNPFAVVTSAGELHYGGHGWVMETGEEFNRQDAADRLVYARNRMLEEVVDRGKPEVFYYAAGHDYFNCDTDKQTTTKGTDQEMDGTTAQALAEGLDLAAKDIEILSMVAPVVVLSVPGNHDRLLTIALIKFLEAWNRNNDQVTVKFSARSRAYELYGSTCLAFLHGDGAIKPNNYVATMLKEAPELCNEADFRAFFSGHLHSEVVRELVAGKHFQMSSLRGRDKFHEKNAYLSDAALCSYVVDKKVGVKSTIFTHLG